MTKAELLAALAECCIEDNDPVVFAARVAVGGEYSYFEFYQPVAYECGFVVIEAIEEAKEVKR